MVFFFFRIFGVANLGRMVGSQEKPPHLSKPERGSKSERRGREATAQTRGIAALPEDEKSPKVKFLSTALPFLCVLQDRPVIKLTFRNAGRSGKPERSFRLLRLRVEVEWQVTNTVFTRGTVTSASFFQVVPPPLEVFQHTFNEHGRALKRLSRHVCSQLSEGELIL